MVQCDPVWFHTRIVAVADDIVQCALIGREILTGRVERTCLLLARSLRRAQRCAEFSTVWKSLDRRLPRILGCLSPSQLANRRRFSDLRNAAPINTFTASDAAEAPSSPSSGGPVRTRQPALISQRSAPTTAQMSLLERTLRSVTAVRLLSTRPFVLFRTQIRPPSRVSGPSATHPCAGDSGRRCDIGGAV